MATKALNMKWDSGDLEEIKKVASAFHMTVTEFFKEAAADKLASLKKDPYYRLTASVENADIDETEEVLHEIDALSDDDLSISSRKTITM